MRALASYVTGLTILATIMFVGGAWTPAGLSSLADVDVHPSHASFTLAESLPITTAPPTTVTELPPGCVIPLEAATCAITVVAGGLDVPASGPDPEPEVSPPAAVTTAAPAEPRRVLVPRNVEVWRPLVAAYFGPNEVERALRVIYCESSGDPSAKNPSSSASGLFQHLRRFWGERSVDAGWAGADIFDPEANIAVASWLVYQGGGWSHWNPSRHCWG